MKWGSYIIMHTNPVLDILDRLNLNGFDKPSGTDKASDHSYDLFYSKELCELPKDLSILEIGSYRGGSLVLWNELLSPKKIVSIDIEDNLSEWIRKCLQSKLTFIETDAYSPNWVLDHDDCVFDIIFEDGSHRIQDQEYTLANYPFLLNPGGRLYIEDIQSIDYAYHLQNNIFNYDNMLKSKFSISIHDFREVKGRYDDIIVKVQRV